VFGYSASPAKLVNEDCSMYWHFVSASRYS
jgi:hypothetical protein